MMDEREDKKLMQGQTLPRGTVVGGKYEILRVIGRGGMSVVYQVNDRRLNRNWALKAVRRDGFHDHAMIRRGLITEIGVLKRLSHPGLPRIVDVIEEGDLICVVMDYLEGRTLREVVDLYGPRPQEEVAAWGIQLCGVLSYLHSRKPPIIYRDMKPGNIMLKPEGGLVLFDFGIAREMQPGSTADTICMGTIGYAAPEQFGERGQTDPRTDIYGLGATLYHLVTGRNPGEPPYHMVPIREIDPALSSGLEAVLLKCTRSDPDERYQNCAELLYDLENYGKLEAGARKVMKRKVAAFSVCLAMSLACFLTAGAGWRGMKAARDSDYNTRLAQAGRMATASVREGNLDEEVLAEYAAVIAIDPSRAEAYLRVLDYTVRVGEMGAGLDLVCPFLDSGEGGIEKNDALLLRVASLCLRGGSGGDDYPGDYPEAAACFARVDRRRHPEAVWFGAVAEALGSFSSEIDWENVGGALAALSEYAAGQPLSLDRVLNEELAASVYIAGRRELMARGEEPYAAALDLLGRAEEGALALLADAEAGAAGLDVDELAQLYRQILRDMAGAYASAHTVGSAAGDFDKAIDCYGRLLPLADSEKEVRWLHFRIADLACRGENEAHARAACEELIGRYGDSADAYVTYAGWLFGRGETEEAARMYTKAVACEDAGESAQLAWLGVKLRNAGVVE